MTMTLLWLTLSNRPGRCITHAELVEWVTLLPILWWTQT